MVDEPEPWAERTSLRRPRRALLGHGRGPRRPGPCPLRQPGGDRGVLGWPSGTFPSSDRRAGNVYGVRPCAPRRPSPSPRVDVRRGTSRTGTRINARSSDSGGPTGRGAGSRRSAPTGSTTRRCEAIVVNARDISERRAADEALRASQERFRSLVQHASEFVLVYGADSRSLRQPGRRPLPRPGPGRVARRTAESGLPHPDDRDASSGTASPPCASLRGRSGRLHAPGSAATTASTAGSRSVVTNLLDDENVGGLVVNARDVTDRPATPRRRSARARKGSAAPSPTRRSAWRWPTAPAASSAVNDALRPHARPHPRRAHRPHHPRRHPSRRLARDRRERRSSLRGRPGRLPDGEALPARRRAHGLGRAQRLRSRRRRRHPQLHDRAGRRHHRAQGDRRAAGPPGDSRPADRAPEPHPVHRASPSHHGQAVAAPPPGRGAVPRPRQLQGHQRQPRPRRRRPAARHHRASPARHPATQRHRRPLRR